jgi:hypothetical protein
MDTDVRVLQHDILAWHIWNWRIHDEVWQYHGDAETDSNYAWNILYHFETQADNKDWIKQEKDYGKWREFLSKEYIAYIIDRAPKTKT